MSENSPTTAVFTSTGTINPVLSPRRITGSLYDFINMCCSATRRYDTVTIEATVDGGVRMIFQLKGIVPAYLVPVICAAVAEQEVGP